MYFLDGVGGYFYGRHDAFMLVFLVRGAVLLTCSVYLREDPRMSG